MGREAELELIDAVLGTIGGGRASALAFVGRPGLGKSTLLDVAVARARDAGCSVMRSDAIATETDTDFAALGDLFGDRGDDIDALAPPQRHALRVALALDDGVAPRPQVLGAGVHALLVAAAARSPILIALDDAHRLDVTSAECLAFATRRLTDQPIGLLLTVDTTVPERWAWVGTRHLAPLSAEASDSLLRRVRPRLAPAARRAIIAGAGGDPRALLELPTTLDDEQRRGRAPLPDPLPVASGSNQHAKELLARFTKRTRTALLVAAAAHDRSVDTLRRAGATLGVDLADLERAEDAGILHITADRVDFTDPFARSAAYHDATPSEQRRAHAALAEATPINGDAHAYHRSRAIVGRDDEVGDLLVAAADRAEARGDLNGAAEAFEQAARFADDPQRQAAHYFAAGERFLTNAQPARALGALARASELADRSAPVRASIDRAHGLALRAMGRAAEAKALWLESAKPAEETRPSIAVGMLADAASTAMQLGDCAEAVELAERGVELMPDDTHGIPAYALAVLAAASAARGDTDRAVAALHRIDSTPQSSHRGQLLAQPLALQARLWLGDAPVVAAMAAAQVSSPADPPRAGTVMPITILADACFHLGRWDECAHLVSRALDAARDSGFMATRIPAARVAARLAAARGDHAALATLRRTLAGTRDSGIGFDPYPNSIDGFAALGEGRIADAVTLLQSVADTIDPKQHVVEPAILPWRSDLVEALVIAGQLDSAREHLGRLELAGSFSPNPFTQMMLARSAGLVGTTRHGIDDFERGLTITETMPFERARTLLAYGARLHRAHRRVDARARLREAIAIFSELRAAPWLARAEHELDAAGARRRTAGSDPAALTDRELEVARCVARGLTNREVAAELFLSSKTIEFHLKRIYDKLGVRSRAGLISRLATGFEIG